MKKLDLAVLVSGRGSNLQAIIDAIEAGKISAHIKCVISNVPGVQSLDRAKKHNIPSFVIDHKKFQNKDEYENEIVRILNENGVDLVCLAGYMRIVGEVLLKAYKGKIINIHPALLPSFPGLHSQKQALDYGVKISGCTVHFVDEGCDTGPVILQASVPVLDDDTEDSLSARILEEEHKLYPRAIQLIAEGKYKISGRKVILYC
jgi:phosphoribosylglycinamide formyltransferase-1